MLDGDLDGFIRAALARRARGRARRGRLRTARAPSGGPQAGADSRRPELDAREARDPALDHPRAHRQRGEPIGSRTVSRGHAPRSVPGVDPQRHGRARGARLPAPAARLGRPRAHRPRLPPYVDQHGPGRVVSSRGAGAGDRRARCAAAARSRSCSAEAARQLSRLSHHVGRRAGSRAARSIVVEHLEFVRARRPAAWWRSWSGRSGVVHNRILETSTSRCGQAELDRIGRYLSEAVPRPDAAADPRALLRAIGRARSARPTIACSRAALELGARAVEAEGGEAGRVRRGRVEPARRAGVRRPRAGCDR